MLADGWALYLYRLPETAATTSILITVGQGDAVFTGQGETAASRHLYYIEIGAM